MDKHVKDDIYAFLTGGLLMVFYVILVLVTESLFKPLGIFLVFFLIYKFSKDNK